MAGRPPTASSTRRHARPTTTAPRDARFHSDYGIRGLARRSCSCCRPCEPLSTAPHGPARPEPATGRLTGSRPARPLLATHSHSHTTPHKKRALGGDGHHAATDTHACGMGTNNTHEKKQQPHTHAGRAARARARLGGLLEHCALDDSGDLGDGRHRLLRRLRVDADGHDGLAVLGSAAAGRGGGVWEVAGKGKLGLGGCGGKRGGRRSR